MPMKYMNCKQNIDSKTYSNVYFKEIHNHKKLVRISKYYLSSVFISLLTLVHTDYNMILVKLTTSIILLALAFSQASDNIVYLLVPFFTVIFSDWFLTNDIIYIREIENLHVMFISMVVFIEKSKLFFFNIEDDNTTIKVAMISFFILLCTIAKNKTEFSFIANVPVALLYLVCINIIYTTKIDPYNSIDSPLWHFYFQLAFLLCCSVVSLNLYVVYMNYVNDRNQYREWFFIIVDML